MYRRMLFVAILPLLGLGAVRAGVGCALGLATVIYYREASPFRSATTNVLLVAGCYQVPKLPLFDHTQNIHDKTSTKPRVKNLGLTVLEVFPRFLSEVFWRFNSRAHCRWTSKKPLDQHLDQTSVLFPRFSRGFLLVYFGNIVTPQLISR
jgi:hypothetical protein